MNILVPGKASIIIGGQWGSCGKGAVAAWFAAKHALRGEVFSIHTTNAGAQAGHTSIHRHTSIHNYIKRVAFHLPTASLIAQSYGFDYVTTYLNAGSIIDADVLEQELVGFNPSKLFIHPNAAVIWQSHRDHEGGANSSTTRIASTRKGVGAALADKLMRRGNIAANDPYLTRFTRRLDLNQSLADSKSVLVEVPQGVGLSLNGSFYPYCTSRDCTVMQALSDAGIHPSFLGPVVLVLRTYPIRVGNITDDMGREIGHSGGCYEDQLEITWEDIGVEPEYTTVTKRKRRIFTFSEQQAREAMSLSRPDVVVLTFCNYIAERRGVEDLAEIVKCIGRDIGKVPEILYEYGPTTEDIFTEPK